MFFVRRIMIAIAVAIAALFVVATPTSATTGTCPGPGWILGDSITVQSSPAFLADHPEFTADGRNGRHLYTLPSLLRAHLADTGQRTGTIVLALGTNDRWPGEDTPTLTRAKYVAAVDTIPQTVKVVLVTPYRHAPVVGQWQADRMAEITGWQKDLDRYRPNVTIASWRYRIVTDGPERYLVSDGVHPNEAGRAMWVEQMERAITVAD